MWSLEARHGPLVMHDATREEDPLAAMCFVEVAGLHDPHTILRMSILQRTSLPQNMRLVKTLQRHRTC